MYRFFHCSDWHAPVPALSGTGGAGLKQLLARLSWRYSRHRRHQSAVLEAAMDVWVRSGVNRICVTGDVVNFAMRCEFEAAVVHLQRLREVCPVDFVPGNHDVLVRSAIHEHRALCQVCGVPVVADDPWPTCVTDGRLAFLGLSSALPTPPWMAYGEVPQAQLSSLEKQLRQLGQAGYFRVVMLHHPPHAGAAGWRRSLHRAEGLRSVLERTGAELVLHGHMHHPGRAFLPGPGGAIPVFGAGSASYASRGTKRGHFSLFAVEPERGEGWRIHVTDYFFDAGVRRFVPGAGEQVTPQGTAVRVEPGAAEANDDRRSDTAFP